MTNRSRNLLIAGFVLAVVALVAIGSIINRPSNSADQDLFTRAKTQLAQTDSATMRLELETAINPAAVTGQEAGLMESINLPIAISGPFNLDYPAGGRLAGEADLNFTAGMGLVQLMKLSLRLTDNGTMFAQVQDLPDDTGLQVSFDGVEGGWFSFAGQDLLRLMSWLDMTDAEPVAGQAVPFSADVLRASVGRWLSAGDRQADTTLANQAAAHFELAVDQELLADFLSDLTGELRGNKVSVQERAAITKYIQSRQWLAESWVSQSSGHLLMFKLGVFPIEGVEGQAFSLTLAFGEFNQSIEPAVPEESVPLSTMLEKMPAVSGR
jgi:hypothetical protein